MVRPEAEVVVDALAHLGSLGGPRLLLKRFARHPGEALLSSLLTWTEPIAHPRLGRLATFGRHGWPQALSQAMSDLGWPQVQAIFSRLGVRDMVADMDRSGIAPTWVHTLEPYFPSEPVIEAISAYSGRFSLSVGLDPYHLDPEARLAELLERHPIHGLKIHPQLQLIHLGDPRLDRLMGLAERHRLAVTFHTGTFAFRTCGWEDARLLVPLLDACSRQPVILAHIDWDQSERVLDLASRRPWVLVETSWQDPATIGAAVQRLGADRVLFGSDWPLLKVRYALAHVRRALPPGPERDAVLGGSAMQLLGLKRVSAPPAALGRKRTLAVLSSEHPGNTARGWQAPTCPPRRKPWRPTGSCPGHAPSPRHPDASRRPRW